MGCVYVGGATMLPPHPTPVRPLSGDSDPRARPTVTAVTVRQGGEWGGGDGRAMLVGSGNGSQMEKKERESDGVRQETP